MKMRDLYHDAQRWWLRDMAPRTRVAVQVGHCTQAVGAAEVLQKLRNALAGRDEAYLVLTGCDGACFNGPQVIVTTPDGNERRYGRVTPQEAQRIAENLDAAPPPDPGTDAFFAGQHRWVLRLVGRIDPGDIREYLLEGGYQALERALSLSAKEVIAEVERAGLRGRGGAYFPAAVKWRGARAVQRTPRYIVVNAEEGEPGIFKDRHLMEGCPHAVIEGLLIAGYASGAERGIIYINAEADLSAECIAVALEQARKRNLVGEGILESDFSFQIEVRRGAGGYVCGEETTLLNTIEGVRRVPRLRPPFPVERGVFDQPTVINNVETLCNVPLILREGVEAFTGIGLDDAHGTKLLCLSGSVLRPGLVEVPLGTPIRHVVEAIGGGAPEGRRVAAVGMGGPSGGLLPASEMDLLIRPGFIREPGVVLGSGGVIAIDDGTPILDVVRRLAAYNAAESCGKCTPCREGTPRMVEALDRLLSGHGTPADLDELRELSDVVGAASLCGLGQMAGNPIMSALEGFREEFERLVKMGG